MLGKRIMIDTSKCIGCRACQVACKQWHSLPSEDTTFTGVYTNPPDMSGANLTVVKFIECLLGQTPIGAPSSFLFFKDQCRHCENPMCKAGCPLGAIKKHANGAVRINPDKCDPSQCGSGAEWRPCQVSCPFKKDGLGIARWKYVKGGAVEGEKMRKCDFCYNRIMDKFRTGSAERLELPIFKSTDGKTKSTLPSCQVTCPPGAITSGKADATMNKAIKRVDYLKRNGYPNANVYPQPSGIGTHVIWVLVEDPTAYGLTPA